MGTINTAGMRVCLDPLSKDYQLGLILRDSEAIRACFEKLKAEIEHPGKDLRVISIPLGKKNRECSVFVECDVAFGARFVGSVIYLTWGRHKAEFLAVF
jgi:hypothetical protein